MTSAAPRPVLTGPERPRLLKAGDVRAREVRVAEAAEVAAARASELEAARNAGYEDGVRDARAAAETAGVAAGPRLAAALERLAAETARLDGAEIDATGDAVLTAALDIAGWILRTDPATSSAGLLDRLNEAARTLAPCSRTIVKVSGADLAAATEWAREGVEVNEDPRLSAGEAVLERADGRAALIFSDALRRAAATLGIEGPA
jgi:flagellar biosynthesis/type III secretory pathway protein FliH